MYNRNEYEHARLCIAINFKIEYWLLPKLAKGIRELYIIIVELFELNITAETYTKYNNIYYCELFIISEKFNIAYIVNRTYKNVIFDRRSLSLTGF